MYKILITSSNLPNTLENIAHALIKKRLSPCTQIIKDVKSFYLWDGEINSDNEQLLLIKCTLSNAQAVEEVIYNYHNYEVPEIISHEFEIISKKYKKWFNEN